VVAEIDVVSERTGQEVTNFISEYKPLVVVFLFIRLISSLRCNWQIVKLVDPGIVVVSEDRRQPLCRKRLCGRCLMWMSLCAVRGSCMA